MEAAAFLNPAMVPPGTTAHGNSQLRKHLPRGPVPRLRWLYQWRRLGRCGRGVHFDENVRLMRYPQSIFVCDHAVIKEGARICACNEHASVRIGRNTTVGYYSFVFASASVDIGDDCLIAPFVYIVDSNHGTSRDLRINQQGNRARPIEIGDDVWIGVGGKLLAGTRVGTGAIVAAGAVVSGNVEPYSIVGGIPARKIGERE